MVLAYSALGSPNTAVRTLLHAYWDNWTINPERARSFMDSCRELGLAFSDLQVARVAASSKLFPLPNRYSTDGMPTCVLRPGDFIQADFKETSSSEPWRWKALAPCDQFKSTVGSAYICDSLVYGYLGFYDE